MSIELMNHVWKHADVTGSELLVLLALADYSNEQGICWPSLNTIGQKARISRRQVIRILQKLGEMGLVEVLEPGGVIGGQNRANLYKIHSDKMTLRSDVMTPASDTVTLRSVTHDTRGSVTHDTTVVSPMSPQSPYNHHKEPSGEEAEGAARQPAAAADPDTAMVWDVWQRNMPGTITPILSDSLNSLIDEYGAQDVVRGLTIQVERGKQTAGVRYLRGILERGVFSQPVKGNGAGYTNGSAPRTKVQASMDAIDRVFDQLAAQGAFDGK